MGEVWGGSRGFSFRVGFKEPVMSPRGGSGGKKSIDWHDHGVTCVLTVSKAVRWADQIQSEVRNRDVKTLMSVCLGSSRAG